jgi:hypothetical protein
MQDTVVNLPKSPRLLVSPGVKPAATRYLIYNLPTGLVIVALC